MSYEPAVQAFGRLLEIMHRLRAPGGCPWDREQTHASLRPYLLEEAYEVMQTIDDQDDDGLCEELGDLLLQVAFHAELAHEGGRFDAAAVVDGICRKLVNRHPHVFGDAPTPTANEVMTTWHRLKDAELGDGPKRPVGDLVPQALPALARAQKVGSKLARRGFDWPDATAVLDKLDEERRELGDAVRAGDAAACHRELGDVLLTLTSLARHLGVSAELSLRDATTRLLERSAHVEAAAQRAGQEVADLDEAERERLWERAKRS
jgi:tetrapyrrole methylase family protein/MazG family protein